MNTKERAKELREVLKQRMLCNIVDVTPSYFSNWINGKLDGIGIEKKLSSHDPIEKTFYTKNNKIKISIEKR